MKCETKVNHTVEAVRVHEIMLGVVESTDGVLGKAACVALSDSDKEITPLIFHARNYEDCTRIIEDLTRVRDMAWPNGPDTEEAKIEDILAAFKAAIGKGD